MTTKTLEDARFKATQTTSKTRVLDFYACTFTDVPDKSGDTIDPRALDDWLKSFYAAGKPLPISFAHSAVLDSTDPYNIIGSAPADPSHVWTDDYGLRVKATLNVGSNDTARYVADLIDQGIITGASVAFTVTKEGKNEDGSARIMQMQVKEAGPCLSPANEEAVVLALKAVRDELKGDPKETEPDPEPEPAEDLEAFLKHANSPIHVQAAHDAMVRAGAKCATVGEIVKTELTPDVTERLRNLRWLESLV